MRAVLLHVNVAVPAEEAEEAGVDLPWFGCLSRGEERRIVGEVWRSIVDPCLRVLLRDRTGAAKSDAAGVGGPRARA